MITLRYMPNQPFTAVHRECKKLATTWSKAFWKLESELHKLGARDVVLECGYRPDQVRRDGLPKGDAKPEHSCVRLSFTRKGEPMCFSFGGWKETHNNVYMIAMTLDRLRAVARYGCTQGDQQYKGFAALPPGSVGGGGMGGSGVRMAAEWSSVSEAMRYLSRVGDGEVVSEMAEDLETVYRAAAKVAHPDAGGNAELMSRVNRARAYVRAASGVS